MMERHAHGPGKNGSWIALHGMDHLYRLRSMAHEKGWHGHVSQVFVRASLCTISKRSLVSPTDGDGTSIRSVFI